MKNQTSTFQTVLDTLLAGGNDFPRRYLQQFSDIGPLELKTLLEVWPRVKPDRKLSLLEGLRSLAEKDSLVNFNEFALAVLTDTEATVRVQAIRLLGECDNVKLISAYLGMLKNDPDVDVRAEAATALNLFVDLGELDELTEEAYGEIQAGLLESAKGTDDARVRRHALESLGYASDNADVVELIESAFDRESVDWKVSALVAMGRSADDRWEDRVLRSMLDDNDDIRKAAVQSAGLLSLNSARVPLLRALETEEDGDVISAAIWSLSQIGGDGVQIYIESLIDSTEDEELLEFLEEALENLTFTEDLNRFELMSFDPDDIEDLEVLEDLEDLEKLDGDEDE